MEPDIIKCGFNLTSVVEQQFGQTNVGILIAIFVETNCANQQAKLKQKDIALFFLLSFFVGASRSFKTQKLLLFNFLLFCIHKFPENGSLN
jgi:hypothetical protein